MIIKGTEELLTCVEVNQNDRKGRTSLRQHDRSLLHQKQRQRLVLVGKAVRKTQTTLCSC